MSGRTGLWRLAREYDLVLLIPNCTRHRMITYTNYDNDRNYIDNYMSNHSYDNYIHLLVHSYEKML